MELLTQLELAKYFKVAIDVSVQKYNQSLNYIFRDVISGQV